MRRTTTMLLLLFLCSTSALLSQNTRFFLKVEPQGTSGQPLLVEAGKDVQFSAKAFEPTAQGTMVEVQIDQLQWSVDPAGFGSITAAGLFTPGDPGDPSFVPIGRIIAHATIGSVTIESHVLAAFDNGGGQGDFTIRGTVMDGNRQPIARAHIAVMHAGPLPVIFDGYTNGSGEYEVRVPAGSYVVLAEAQGYVSEFYDDAATRDKATEITTDPAKKVIDHIDFVLADGQNHQYDYAFQGTVKDASGSPIEGALVSANSTMGMQMFNFRAMTDANGEYSIATPAGTYIIHASADGFIPEFYDDVRDASQAKELATDANNKTTTGIDFVLGAGGSITGTVTAAADGSPLAGAMVQIILKASNPSFPPNGGGIGVQTGQNGAYTISGLPTGDYIVMAVAQGYSPLFYDGKIDPSMADAVSVTEGGTTSGIDFALQEEPDLTPKYLISGVVEDMNGNPLMDAFVHAESTDPAVPDFYGRVNRSGEYEIHVPAGTFRVAAEAPGYAGEYYDDVYDASQATELTLSDTQTSYSDIDFALSTGGSISGVVLRASDNSPIKHAHVFIVDKTASGGIIPPNGGPGSITDENGEYMITGLGTGSYVVAAVADGYAQQFYDNVDDVAQATGVSVTVNQESTGIDFALATLPGISGTVTDRATGQPIEFAMVFVENAARNLYAQTAADGTYHLALPPGDYVVRAEAQGYMGEYYDNVTDPAQATTISVTVGGPDQTGIDFALGEGGVITGVVRRASDNAPVADAVVALLGRNGTPSGAGNSYATHTDASGMYRITGLGTGTYQVMTYKNGYEAQYYDMASDPSNATDVSVTVDQTTSGIDFLLAAAPGISGQVTDAATGDPIPRAEIMAEGPGIRPFYAYTDSDGNYHLALPAGSFKVRASAPMYAYEWYNEQADHTLADDVVVAAGAQVTGIDFTLETIGTGTISGTVTDGSGNPIADAAVFVITSNSNPAGIPFHGKVSTEQDGSYEITGLPAGSYRVMAHAMGFIPEFYDNAMDFQNATPVQVVKDQTAAGIDFELGLGGSISGTVTDEDSGNPLPHAFVHVRMTNSHVEFGARSDSQGQYEVNGLPDGDYIVYAAAPHHAGEFYDDAADPASATPVTVTAPNTTANIDFALANAPRGPRTFKGSITLRGGNPMEPMMTIVEAVNPQTGAIVRTTTDMQGGFEFDAWDNAVIRARALGYVGVYAGGTYDWQKSHWNGFAGGMNIALDRTAETGPFSLTGTATDARTGAAVADAWIYGIDASGAVHFAVSGPDGSFAIPNTGESLDLMVSAVGYDMHNSSADGARGEQLSLQLSPTGVTGVEHPKLPTEISLKQNYPNPFNPSTTITFAVPARMHVKLTVFNLLGSEISTLVDGTVDAGTHSLSWNAAGQTSGVYIYRLEANGSVQTRRMLLTK